MSDIVERLRGHYWPKYAGEDLRGEAADEIERLRAAHDHQYGVAGTMLREAERYQRENDALREDFDERMKRALLVNESRLDEIGRFCGLLRELRDGIELPGWARKEIALALGEKP